MKINKKNIIKLCVMITVVVAILVLDLVTKYVFDSMLSDGQTKTIIPALFNFKQVHNYGAAWGSFAGQQVLLIIVTFVFLAIFAWFYIQEKNKSWLFNIAFGMIFAGCIGNLFDRLVFGYVRDFIQFAFWTDFPVFNFADAALCIGVVLFVISMLVGGIKNRKNANKSQKEGEKNE